MITKTITTPATISHLVIGLFSPIGDIDGVSLGGGGVGAPAGVGGGGVGVGTGGVWVGVGVGLVCGSIKNLT